MGDSFYVRATNQAAFCHPYYPQALIANEEERASARASARTQPEWKAYFAALEAAEANKFSTTDDYFKPPVAVKLDFDPSLSLKTPAKRLIDGYVERMWDMDLTPHIEVPKLPMTSGVSTEEEFWENSKTWNQPTELLSMVRNLYNSFVSLGDT